MDCSVKYKHNTLVPISKVSSAVFICQTADGQSIVTTSVDGHYIQCDIPAVLCI